MVLGPACRPLLSNDDAALAGLSTRSGELHYVLTPVGSVEQELATVGRPLNVVGIVPDDRIVERLSVAHVELHSLLRVDGVDQKVGYRIVHAGFRISFDIHPAL